MADHPLPSRFQKHVLAFLLAPPLALLCMLVCVPLAVWVAEDLLFLMGFAGGAGWMVGGLIANKGYPESGPMLVGVGAGLAGWALAVVDHSGSAMRGLFELQSLCFGVACTGWLVLRSDRKARRQSVWVAVTVAITVTLLALQLRVPGRRTVLTHEDGSLERVVLAQPLSEAWRNTHGAHPISRADDAEYIWRASANADRSTGEAGLLCSDAMISGGPCYRLIRLTEAGEIEAAYTAFWQTEEWLLGWEVARSDLPFFMPALSSLRGDWRRGSIWRAERRDPPPP